MAIDIKPDKKKKFKLPGFFDVLFYYSIVLLLVTLSGYLLISQWNSELQQKAKKKDEVIQRLTSNDDLKNNQKEISSVKNKIDNYLFLLSKKKDIEHLLLFLEEMIHPMASIEEISLGEDDDALRISGYALDYEALEEQYTILKNFSMERNLIGWVLKSGIKKEDSNNLVIDSKSLKVYDNPVTAEKTLNEIQEILDQKADEDLSQEKKDELDGELSLLKSEEKENLKTIIKDKKGREIRMLNEPTVSDYSFNKGEYELIAKDWYEVAVPETIKPVKEVELVEVSEADKEFNVSFEFNIVLDPIIFNK